MEHLSSPGLIPVGESPNATSGSLTPRRTGSFSFRIGRKSSTPSINGSMDKSFSFDEPATEKVKLRQKTSSQLTPSVTTMMRNSKDNRSINKDKEKAVLNEMGLESER